MKQERPDEDQKRRISAILNTRKLVLRYAELEEELEKEKRRNDELVLAVARMEREEEPLKHFAEIGRREIEQRKKESLSRLRAIVHFSGEQDRLTVMERMLSDELLTPEEIALLHRKITEEFRSLYPSRSVSRPPDDSADLSSSKGRWQSYRLRVN